MNARRTISLILVLTLCVSTTACSTTTRVDLRVDPSDSSTRARFEAGEELEVTSYARVSDGHRDWKGLVQLAPPDSVQFTPSSKTYRHEFKILRSDLASIDYQGVDTRIATLPPVAPQEQVGVAAADPENPRTPEISVVTASAGGMSKRSRQRALTIGIFVAVVGAVAIGYVAADQ